MPPTARAARSLRSSGITHPLRAQYGADLDARTPKNWTPLSYAKAKGKYGVTHEKGIYPEDVLKVRSVAPLLRCAPQLMRRAVLRRNRVRHRPAVPRQPQARMRCAALQPWRCMCVHGALSRECRSPRESYNPEAENFSRERGSYQNEPEHP